MGPIYYKFTSEHFFQKQEVYGAGRTWHGLLLFIALMIELLFNTRKRLDFRKKGGFLVIHFNL